MGEPALGDGFGVKVHVLDVAGHFVAVHVHDGVSAPLDFHHVVVVQVHHLLGVVDDGGHVAGQEKFTFVPDTENQGAPSAGANQGVGFVAAYHRKAKCAFDKGKGLEDSLFQVAVVVLGNQVGHHFGIRFGLEGDAFFDKFRLEARVVFDNAVVDDGNFPVKTHVGVGILFGRGTVGGPAGVGDTDVSLDGSFLELGFQGADFTGSTDGLDFPVVDKGYPRAVVATIFQLFKAAHENRKSFILTDIGDYSAHIESSIKSLCPNNI